MPGWIDQYKALRAAWVSARGVGAEGTSGQLPRMIAGDCLALLGPVSGAVIRFHEGRIRQWQVSGAIDPAAGGSRRAQDISIIGYLMRGVPHPREARKRILTLNKLPGASTTPGAHVDAYVHPNMLGFELEEAQKQLMASWQATLNLAAQYLKIAPVTRPLSQDEIKGFWSKLYGLVVALDVAGDTPLQSDWDAAKEIAVAVGRGTQEVLRDAADVAGRAAAEIAQTAGEAAGAAAGGFFDQVGLTGLVVASGALYIALQ